jgi:hypothetical protein
VAAAPFRERAHVLEARGNGAEALRVHEALRDERGAAPAPELRALQAELLRRLVARICSGVPGRGTDCANHSTRFVPRPVGPRRRREPPRV